MTEPPSAFELGFTPIVWSEHNRDYPEIQTRVDRFGRTRYRAVIYLSPTKFWDRYSARAGSMEALVRKWNRRVVRWQRSWDRQWRPLE